MESQQRITDCGCLNLSDNKYNPETILVTIKRSVIVLFINCFGFVLISDILTDCVCFRGTLSKQKFKQPCNTNWIAGLPHSLSLGYTN